MGWVSLSVLEEDTMTCRQKKPCKNCRKKPKNLESSPKRPARGSIRKAKRQEMRRQKKRRLTAEKAHESSVESTSGNTVSESVVSVVQLNVESLTKPREAEVAEGMFPAVPYV